MDYSDIFKTTMEKLFKYFKLKLISIYKATDHIYFQIIGVLGFWGFGEIGRASCRERVSSPV